MEIGSEKYAAIAESNIVKSLEAAFEVEALSKADLAQEAAEYIRAIGLSDEEIVQLRKNLCAEADADATERIGTGIAVAVCVVGLMVCVVALSRKKGRK